MEGEYSVIDFNAVDSTGEPLQSSAKRRNSKKYPRKDEWAMGEAQEDLGLPKSDGSNIMSTSRHTDRIDGTLDPYIDDFCMYEDWPPASPAADENIGFTINSGWSSTFFPV
ncbi:hypothetical protein N7468_001843 [Penicillium chermesinum]|uniref:Uncharacterized protein n=1 Tax=Penicillium chermesinum TaxID=63820 RepID=A0A9W9PHC1_9EURO|nr:uncharacterized protein N7468_001843 [Penicillium chermesinum]KAJ5246860.1 hypothetical protein N7468_001843 [Penicillium chermesinum]